MNFNPDLIVWKNDSDFITASGIDLNDIFSQLLCQNVFKVSYVFGSQSWSVVQGFSWNVRCGALQWPELKQTITVDGMFPLSYKRFFDIAKKLVKKSFKVYNLQKVLDKEESRKELYWAL